MCSLEHAYQAAAIENPDDEGAAYPPEVVPKKKKQLLRQGHREGAVSAGVASNPAPTTKAPSPPT